MSTSRIHLASVVTKAAACGLLLTVLAACQSQQQDSQVSQLALSDYGIRHPIVVSEQPETFDMPVGAQTRHLGPQLADSVMEFAAESRRRGNGRVEILVPSGGINEAAIHSVTPEVRKALHAGGLSRSAVTTRSYAVTDPGSEAPIRLSYMRVKASAGPCGTWPSSIDGKFNSNVDYENYGCATQANLAAMVENPSDLLRPRASTPVDQQRRAETFKQYRSGEIKLSSESGSSLTDTK
ncbi:CpaD family pilus assembly protein [Roseibium litorale]|uniref:CpaD family pilus assembly protein n=1 Tax=Roseibium litorale TaxID=2803841 RepID=A0ABR9CNL4_9HYPH|nr:CpaD family pilus assembly protein [Roseibium litorale]MBD8892323.1 CpaD family pilus assembly protein [Roseibium litorale]